VQVPFGTVAVWAIFVVLLVEVVHTW